VTILVNITYRWQLTQLHEVPMLVQKDPKLTLKEWVKEFHFYISNDTQHESLFVQHFFMF